jgi:hypothetical protein
MRWRTVLIALLVACPGAPPPQQPVMQNVERVQPCEPCLTFAPPEPPTPTGDDAVDRGRRADAYTALERYVRLHVVPCLRR